MYKRTNVHDVQFSSIAYPTTITTFSIDKGYAKWGRFTDSTGTEHMKGVKSVLGAQSTS